MSAIKDWRLMFSKQRWKGWGMKLAKPINDYKKKESLKKKKKGEEEK